MEKMISFLAQMKYKKAKKPHQFATRRTQSHSQPRVRSKISKVPITDLIRNPNLQSQSIILKSVSWLKKCQMSIDLKNNKLKNLSHPQRYRWGTSRPSQFNSKFQRRLSSKLQHLCWQQIKRRIIGYPRLCQYFNQKLQAVPRSHLNKWMIRINPQGAAYLEFRMISTTCKV